MSSKVTTTVSPKGAFMIASHEAIVPGVYLDKVGVPTFGIGHTHWAGEPDPRRMALGVNSTNIEGTIREAIRVFMKDLKKYEREVVQHFGPMRQHELDGWVSWHFNTGGASKTSAVRHWKAGDKRKAVQIMQQWNKAGGKVSQALIARRQVEADLILNGRYHTSSIPVYSADTNGRVRWSKIDAVSLSEWEAIVGDKPDTPKSGVGLVVAITGAIAALIAIIQGLFS